MAVSFIDGIWRKYLKGSMLVRIILINILLFLLLRFVALLALFLSIDVQAILDWLELPSNLAMLVRRPWTLLSYMFTHYNLWHILFNMLWLYWLGRIFMEFFSPKQLTGLYLLGGWGGAALFLLTCNLVPQLVPFDHFLIGSSASVLAIIVATAFYVPDYKIGLLFFGEVALKWIALVAVLFTLLTVDHVSLLGTCAAHVGGALVGAWFGWRIRRGRDITRPLNAVIDFIVGLFNGRSFKKLRFKRPTKGKHEQATYQKHHNHTLGGVSEEELDEILKKIKVSGYSALTDEERDKLFKVSRDRKS